MFFGGYLKNSEDIWRFHLFSLLHTFIDPPFSSGTASGAARRGPRRRPWRPPDRRSPGKWKRVGDFGGSFGWIIWVICVTWVVWLDFFVHCFVFSGIDGMVFSCFLCIFLPFLVVALFLCFGSVCCDWCLLDAVLDMVRSPVPRFPTRSLGTLRPWPWRRQVCCFAAGNPQLMICLSGSSSDVFLGWKWLTRYVVSIIFRYFPTILTKLVLDSPHSGPSQAGAKTLHLNSTRVTDTDSQKALLEYQVRDQRSDWKDEGHEVGEGLWWFLHVLWFALSFRCECDNVKHFVVSL